MIHCLIVISYRAFSEDRDENVRLYQQPLTDDYVAEAAIANTQLVYYGKPTC